MKEGIVFSMPLEKENILLARLVTAGVCSNLSYDVETAEDIKLAVNEALVVMLKQGVGRVDVRFFCDGAAKCALAVEIAACGEGAAALGENDAIGLQLLEGLVNRAEFDRSGGRITAIRLYQD